MRSASLVFALLLVVAVLACVQFTSVAAQEFDEVMDDVAIAEAPTPMAEMLAADEYAAEFADVEAEFEAEADAEAESMGCMKTTTGLNVRTGRGTNYKVIKTLPAGTQVNVVSSSGGWSQIGSGQYVSSQYLTGCGSAPAPKPAGGNRCSFSAPLYKQCGQSWSGNLMVSQTVCSVGCLMSSVSMGMHRFGKTVNGQAANPGTLNAYLRAHGGYTSGNALYWGTVPGIHYQGQTSDLTAIRNRVCQSNTIVALNLKSRGHWVLATGVNAAGDFLVNDPGFTRNVLPASDVRVAGVYTV